MASTAAAMGCLKMTRSLRFLHSRTWCQPNRLRSCPLIQFTAIGSWDLKKKFCSTGVRRIRFVATESKRYMEQFEQDSRPDSSMDKESSNLVDDTESAISRPLGYQINCWKLWQQGGHSIQEIAKMRNIKEATVFRYLFKCIENGYQIDWSELCIEAHFNLELGIAVIEGIKKATSKMTSSTAASEDIIARINSVWEIKKKSERGLAQIKRCCAPEVTYIHIQILLLMLECEFSLEDVHTTLKFASLEQTEPYEEVENGSSGGTLEQRSIKKMLSEQGFLRWLHERDGASLVEIVTTFRDCDEAYLMHLLLTLEETNQIYRDKGLYRMTKTQYLGESCF